MHRNIHLRLFFVAWNLLCQPLPSASEMSPITQNPASIPSAKDMQRSVKTSLSAFSYPANSWIALRFISFIESFSQMHKSIHLCLREHHLSPMPPRKCRPRLPRFVSETLRAPQPRHVTSLTTRCVFMPWRPDEEFELCSSSDRGTLYSPHPRAEADGAGTENTSQSEWCQPCEEVPLFRPCSFHKSPDLRICLAVALKAHSAHA